MEESNEREILIKGVIMWLGRNLVSEKFSGIHKNDPTKTPNNSVEGVSKAFPILSD